MLICDLVDYVIFLVYVHQIKMEALTTFMSEFSVWMQNLKVFEA